VRRFAAGIELAKLPSSATDCGRRP
jgi:hypothetical protein